MQSHFQQGLDANEANYTPLSPLSLLRRVAEVHGQRTSIVHGPRRDTWATTYERCRRLASALRRRGIGKDDTVSALLFNTPEMVEAHFGVAMAGAVLHSINTRLDAASIAFMLDHAETKVLLTDCELAPVMQAALAQCRQQPLVVDIDDPMMPADTPTRQRLGTLTYEELLAEGDAEFAWELPGNEWDPISLNYTSGTTGDPKGVVYSHRGAYLLAVNNVISSSLGMHPVYLWTVPLFHCNGWGFAWSMAIVAGTNVCLRKVDVGRILQLMDDERVTHFAGAPIVHRMLAEAAAKTPRREARTIRGIIGGAPPPETVLTILSEQGFDITHVYGLTETYGPAVFCEWQPSWEDRPVAERARIKARQGVRMQLQEDLRVVRAGSLDPVPRDGVTLGEVLMRGNLIMKGYLKNERSTRAAFEQGWLHTGDLAVVHEDGYIELRDRAKDIIISGGENISTIEVENALLHHPAISEAAVVAKPDETWGETPCAFVTLRAGHEATAAEIVAFCRERLAHFKCPRYVVFGDLPKTATGKTQKYLLKQRAAEIGGGPS